MITAGTILIAGDALSPACFEFGTDSHGAGWRPIVHGLSQRELEKELAREGWTFFYMATTIKKTAFGFDRTRMVAAALKRLIKAVKLERCNCLQIDQVAMHSFLRMPYISISAHPRHVQRGMVFSSRLRLDGSAYPLPAVGSSDERER